MWISPFDGGGHRVTRMARLDAPGPVGEPLHHMRPEPPSDS